MKSAFCEIRLAFRVFILSVLLVAGTQAALASTTTTWAPPTNAPGTQDISTPITDSIHGQTKDGGLSLGASLDWTGVGLAVLGGNVGIGTSTPQATLDIETGTSLSPSAGLMVAGQDSQFVRFFPSLDNGNYNPTIQTGDSAIVFGTLGQVGAGQALNIVPWSNSTGGLRMEPNGNVTINGAATVMGGDSDPNAPLFIRNKDQVHYGQIIDTTNFHLDSVNGDMYLNFFTGKPIHAMGPLCFGDGTCQTTAGGGSGGGGLSSVGAYIVQQYFQKVSDGTAGHTYYAGQAYCDNGDILMSGGVMGLDSGISDLADIIVSRPSNIYAIGTPSSLQTKTDQPFDTDSSGPVNTWFCATSKGSWFANNDPRLTCYAMCLHAH